MIEFARQSNVDDGETEPDTINDEPTDWQQMFPVTWENRANTLRHNLQAIESVFDLNKSYFNGNAIPHDDRQPRLSWRVATLPYAEANDLYMRFATSETWQSTTNKPLLDEAPLHVSTIDAIPAGLSNILTPYGPQAAFGEAGDRVMLAPDLLDGLADTVCLIEVAAEHAVPWTRPVDFKFNANEEAPNWPAFGLPDEPFVLVGTLDGKVHRVRKDIGHEAWLRLLNRADGEEIDWEELEY